MNENKSNNVSPAAHIPPPEQLELYREALLWLFRWTLAVITIICVPLIIMEFFNKSILTILILVVLAGALGALFSALTRLYTLRQLPEALLLVDNNRPQGKYLLVFCLVPPIVGMIGSAFFYLFMQSGIVTSNVFVNFTCNASNACRDLNCLLSYSPCTPADYAKAIVWGFVAGFSERLVPNVLARLENEGNAK
jgi:hypothetical protein